MALDVSRGERNQRHFAPEIDIASTLYSIKYHDAKSGNPSPLGESGRAGTIESPSRWRAYECPHLWRQEPQSRPTAPARCNHRRAALDEARTLETSEQSDCESPPCERPWKSAQGCT